MPCRLKATKPERRSAVVRQLLLPLAVVAFCPPPLAASDSAASDDQVVREIALTATRYQFTPSQIEVNEGNTVQHQGSGKPRGDTKRHQDDVHT